jgi:thymidylate synthase (FAD)
MEREQVLDHGYLAFIESWGSDERIVEAARMSTGKGFMGWGPQAKCTACGKVWPSIGEPVYGFIHPGCGGTFEKSAGDEKLLAYLWKNKHSTPFEVCGLTVEVQCPVVVVWQWVRHRTLSYNILSGRYAEMPEEDYLPLPSRCFADGGKNKQAGAATGSDPLTSSSALEWLEALANVQAHAQSVYQDGLRRGIPKELARLPLSFARYTRMRGKVRASGSR